MHYVAIHRLFLVSLVGLLLLSACSTNVTRRDHGGSGGSGLSGGSGGSGNGGGVPGLESSSKVDLLLVVDNSRSMADKHDVLDLSIPYFIQRLGQLAVRDVHIGVITSSLGGHGADACAGDSIPSENDRAHLISRSGTGAGDPAVPTYQDLGFLLFDPTQQSTPPGEPDPVAASADVSAIVRGAGEVGCGYEATLEAWYRFLVDPNPFETISVANGTALLEGTDQVLLQQRQAFMRPDSQLVIVILSDENDCSTKDGGQSFLANQIFSGSNPFHLPNARAACAVDPNDPCCKSCGDPPGDGCSEANDNCSGALSNTDDNINLRCFDQKRRFGIDFLWPIDRYTQGLSSAQVADRDGNIVPNPVFADLSASGAPTRSSNLIQVLAVVGVPWQDIARDPQNADSGVMSPDELTGNQRWDVIVGDPANDTKPTDPFMVESVEVRSGANPITNVSLSPPGAPANAINGSEYSISCGTKMQPCNNELQYACIFPLPAPRNCEDPLQPSCDCTDPANDNPLCADNPMGVGKTLQVNAKAYPGLRHLQLLRSLGGRGVVGSVCPPQLSDPNALGFGYRAAFAAVGDGISARLAP